MKKRLIISLSIICLLTWAAVITLMIIPSNEYKAKDHGERVTPLLDIKNSEDIIEFASSIQHTQIEKENGNHGETIHSYGITRTWVEQMSSDGTFAIDELLLTLNID